MATTVTAIDKDTWTLLSSVACYYQNIGHNNVWATEQTALPTETPQEIGKIMIPRRIYNFTPIDGNLYVYSESGNANIAVDPA